MAVMGDLAVMEVLLGRKFWSKKPVPRSSEVDQKVSNAQRKHTASSPFCSAMASPRFEKRRSREIEKKRASLINRKRFIVFPSQVAG